MDNRTHTSHIPSDAPDCLPWCETKAKLDETLAESDRMLAKAKEILNEVENRFSRIVDFNRAKSNGHNPGPYPTWPPSN